MLHKMKLYGIIWDNRYLRGFFTWTWSLDWIKMGVSVLRPSHRAAYPGSCSPPSGCTLIWPLRSDTDITSPSSSGFKWREKKANSQSTLSDAYETAIIIPWSTTVKGLWGRRPQQHRPSLPPTFAIAFKHHWTTAANISRPILLKEII